MRSLLRRITAGLLASIAVTGALVVASVAPASADTFGSWRYLRNGATDYCLATDWSTSVYTWSGCNGAQRWREVYVDGFPNTWMLQNEVTGRCLRQVDYFHVVSAVCNGGLIDFYWFGTVYIHSANTFGVLVSDYSGAVSLFNDSPPANQYWY
ncbi:hypothetical protein ACFFX1_11800 [Dactylosporangium sucinum]|uniref:Ricin B lectin domain-containing protein n=1 Tax=Dactylosporangium sucinum TaxID=1424081 RepID=A0A917WTP2_9ACTN|nr:RICIN domain-containing protein [Dactylosporangium sucinum]GGM27768.1 hypothetical protein GCM10007977_031310 [Dactylosporangium sucinum]